LTTDCRSTINPGGFNPPFHALLPTRHRLLAQSAQIAQPADGFPSNLHERSYDLSVPESSHKLNRPAAPFGGPSCSQAHLYPRRWLPAYTASLAGAGGFVGPTDALIGIMVEVGVAG
jgi:hypothetical protein